MYISWIKTFPLRKLLCNISYYMCHDRYSFSPVHNQNKSEYHSSKWAKCATLSLGVLANPEYSSIRAYPITKYLALMGNEVEINNC